MAGCAMHWRGMRCSGRKWATNTAGLPSKASPKSPVPALVLACLPVARSPAYRRGLDRVGLRRGQIGRCRRRCRPALLRSAWRPLGSMSVDRSLTCILRPDRLRRCSPQTPASLGGMMLLALIGSECQLKAAGTIVPCFSHQCPHPGSARNERILAKPCGRYALTGIACAEMP